METVTVMTNKDNLLSLRFQMNTVEKNISFPILTQYCFHNFMSFSVFEQSWSTYNNILSDAAGIAASKPYETHRTHSHDQEL